MTATPTQGLAWAQPGLEVAIGVALFAFDRPARPDPRLRTVLAGLQGDLSTPNLGHPPLRLGQGRAALAEPEAGAAGPVEPYLGIDVGSVSTELELLDPAGAGAVLDLPAHPGPAGGADPGWTGSLAARFGERLRLLGCGTTGSGRHLAGKLVGADGVKNELTCQLLGARQFVAAMDTILEIGGKDSKFIRVRDGPMADFRINKVQTS